MHNLAGPFITQQGMNFENRNPRNHLGLSLAVYPQSTKVGTYDQTHETVSEFRVKYFVEDLFRERLDKDTIELRVLEFFKDYDKTKDPHIQHMQKRLDQVKR